MKNDKPQLINPLFETSSTKNTEVATSNSLDHVDKCPVCHEPMKILACSGIPAFVCLKHRIVLPTRDD